VQHEGAETVARAAALHGARLVHMSAIGADATSGSLYARTKAASEQAVLAAVPGATIIRPSIVFGPEDDFFNKFASLARFMPALPLIGGGKTRFQPVFAGDVGSAFAAAVAGETRPGATYELGGTEVLSFRDLMKFVLATIDRRRLLLPIPFGLAKLQAAFLEGAHILVPGPPPLTRDQVELLKRDSVVSDAAKDEGRTLAGLGIEPTSMQAIVPSYLWRFRPAGQFQRLRPG
jgi:NADH dehydrogenase